MTTRSASARWPGSMSPVAVLTWANVWNVVTSGSSRSCFSRWAATAESQ
ncbi:MAG: hypothetical protein V9G12_24485 [Microthrixaceae bacterium]